MAGPIYVTVELLGVESGLWCDVCALPSRVVVTVALAGGVVTTDRCRDREH